MVANKLEGVRIKTNENKGMANENEGSRRVGFWSTEVYIYIYIHNEYVVYMYCYVNDL